MTDALANIESDGPTAAPKTYQTPTGQPCPRVVRTDGAVEGSGDCGGCGTCLQFVELAWPD